MNEQLLQVVHSVATRNVITPKRGETMRSRLSKVLLAVMTAVSELRSNFLQRCVQSRHHHLSCEIPFCNIAFS